MQIFKTQRFVLIIYGMNNCCVFPWLDRQFSWILWAITDYYVIFITSVHINSTVRINDRQKATQEVPRTDGHRIMTRPNWKPSFPSLGDKFIVLNDSQRHCSRMKNTKTLCATVIFPTSIILFFPSVRTKNIDVIKTTGITDIFLIDLFNIHRKFAVSRIRMEYLTVRLKWIATFMPNTLIWLVR